MYDDSFNIFILTIYCVIVKGIRIVCVPEQTFREKKSEKLIWF